MVLSYRHGFHAGNIADVLKHAILALCSQSLKDQNKAWVYFDAMAGPGLYDLTSGYANKVGEYKQGIARVRAQAENTPPELAPYLKVLDSLPSGLYPGSPLVAAHFQSSVGTHWVKRTPQIDRMETFTSVRNNNAKMILAELHPAEFPLLSKLFANKKEVSVLREDGFSPSTWESIPSVSLSLIDPSFETSEDYEKAGRTLIKLSQKWPQGMHLLWYPILGSKQSLLRDMLQTLRDELDDEPIVLGKRSTVASKSSNSIKSPVLHAQLCTRSLPKEEGHESKRKRQEQEPFRGLYGSGMVMVNVPNTLKTQLTRLLPWLLHALCEDKKQGFHSIDTLL